MAVSSLDLSESLVTHRGALVRYIRGIVRDDSEAEDLTQETLLRAYDKLSTLEDSSRLVPWLYRIATHVTYDRFRQASYRNRPLSLEHEQGTQEKPALLEVVPDDSPRLDKLMEQREMSSCVQEYIEDLSDPYRAVILLHDVQGLTNPEIAEMLGVSLATVKIRLHRARGKLRAALGEGCSFFEDERGVKVCEPKPPREPQSPDQSRRCISFCRVLVLRSGDEESAHCDRKEQDMSEKECKSMSSCCREEGNGQTCPCKKRICLPILGLAALAIVASMVAKRKGRK